MVELRFGAAGGEERDGVEVSLLAPVHGAEQEVATMLRGESAHEVPGVLMAEDGVRRGGFRPEDQVGLHRNGGEGLVFVGLEDFHFERGIVPLQLRHAPLHGGEGEFGRGWFGIEELAHAVSPHQRDEADREGEIKMRTAHASAEFQRDALDRGGKHEVRQRDEK